MEDPKLSKLEFEIMETLWTRGESSIREIQEAFPAKRKPAYTTIQTTVYRHGNQSVVHRVKKVGNFHIFAACRFPQRRAGRLVDDLLSLFGGRYAAGDGPPHRIRQAHARRTSRKLKKLSAKFKGRASHDLPFPV